MCPLSALLSWRSLPTAQTPYHLPSHAEERATTVSPAEDEPQLGIALKISGDEANHHYRYSPNDAYYLDYPWYHITRVGVFGTSAGGTECHGRDVISSGVLQGGSRQ